MFCFNSAKPFKMLPSDPDLDWCSTSLFFSMSLAPSLSWRRFSPQYYTIILRRSQFDYWFFSLCSFRCWHENVLLWLPNWTRFATASIFHHTLCVRPVRMNGSKFASILAPRNHGRTAKNILHTHYFPFLFTFICAFVFSPSSDVTPFCFTFIYIRLFSIQHFAVSLCLVVLTQFPVIFVCFAIFLNIHFHFFFSRFDEMIAANERWALSFSVTLYRFVSFRVVLSGLVRLTCVSLRSFYSTPLWLRLPNTR